MMKKDVLLLAGLFAACALPTAALQAQTDENDFTSHIANAGFEEGANTDAPFPVTGNNGTFYAPMGWTVTYNASSLASGSQHFSTNLWSTENPSPGGQTAEDANTTPYMQPTQGVGYYHETFFASDASGYYTGGPIFCLEQTLTDLPAGNYTMTADGCVLEQDEAHWFEANGFEYYMMAENEAIGYSARADFPHFMHEAISLPAGTPTVLPVMTTVSVNFVVPEDNQPVKIGFYFCYPGPSAWVQQIYLDNVTLTRTGDRDEVASTIDNETETVYRPLLDASWLELGYDYALDGWTDSIEGKYLGAAANDTYEAAMYYQQQVIHWTNLVDSLIDLRATLQTTVDSAVSAESLNYTAGLEALSTLREAAQAIWNQSYPGADHATLASYIEQLDAAIPEYLRSGCATVTPDGAPVDMTFMIQNPGVDGTQNSYDPNCAPGWTVSAPRTSQAYLSTGNMYPDSVQNTTTYFNAWDGTAGAVDYTASQTITGIPNGVYRLTADIVSDGEGVGVALFAQSAGAYYATEATGNGGVFTPFTVEGITVVDSTLTIGFTSQGDELWGGTPFAGTWLSCDNFTLQCYDSNLTGISDVLEEGLAEAQVAVDANEATALKGDIAIAKAAIAEGEPLVGADPLDYAAIAKAMPKVKAVPKDLQTSTEAATSISDLIAEASIYAESDSSTQESLDNLNAAIAGATAYLQEETSVAADVDSVLDVLRTAMTATQVTGEGQNVTFLIENPDMVTEDGTGGNNGGYTWESSGTIGFYNVTTPTDYYGVPVYHACYWQGSIVDDARFDCYQTIRNIPDGHYKLTVNALYAEANIGDGSGVPNDSVVFYAYGDTRYEVQVPLTVYTIAAGGELAEGDSLLKDPRTWVYSLDDIIVNDNTLRFGIKSIGFMNATTVRWYGFRLTYLGGADDVPPTVGIIETPAAEENVKVSAYNGHIYVEGTDNYQIYTVNGLLVDKNASLMPGIYIVRAGSKVEKIVVD